MIPIKPAVAAVVHALQTPSYVAAPLDDQEAFVAGTASAVAEATCTEGFAELADCVPIWPASQARPLIATLVVLARFESGLNPRIGADKCRPDECDAVKLPGGRVLHLAHGYWQLHQTGLASADEWRESRGAKFWPVHVQARIAIRVLAGSVGKCRGSGAPMLSSAISGFATGSRCWWSGTPAREKIVWSALAKT